MPKRDTRKRKRSLSPHQKQIRFLTGLTFFICLLLAAAVFCIVNWKSINFH